MDGQKDSNAIQANLIENAKKVRQKYMELGRPPAPIEDIQADIIRLNPHTSHPLEERPAAFRTILKTLHDITDDLESERERLRKLSIEQKNGASNNDHKKPPQGARIPIGSQIADMISKHNRPK